MSQDDQILWEVYEAQMQRRPLRVLRTSRAHARLLLVGYLKIRRYKRRERWLITPAGLRYLEILCSEDLG